MEYEELFWYVANRVRCVNLLMADQCRIVIYDFLVFSSSNMYRYTKNWKQGRFVMSKLISAKRGIANCKMFCGGYLALYHLPDQTSTRQKSGLEHSLQALWDFKIKYTNETKWHKKYRNCSGSLCATLVSII